MHALSVLSSSRCGERSNSFDSDTVSGRSSFSVRWTSTAACDKMLMGILLHRILLAPGLSKSGPAASHSVVTMLTPTLDLASRWAVPI